MRLTHHQRKAFKDSAQTLLQKIETRLPEVRFEGQNKGVSQGLAKRLEAYRQQLDHAVRDKELVTINTELVDILYRTNNMCKRRADAQSGHRTGR